VCTAAASQEAGVSDLMPIHKYSNVTVRVRAGEPIDAALRRLKKALGRAGVAPLLRPSSRLFSYEKPSVRRALKARKARSRARRAAIRQRQRDDYLDRMVPPKVVRAA
jgi:ribosomal protein S21